MNSDVLALCSHDTGWVIFTSYDLYARSGEGHELSVREGHVHLLIENSGYTQGSALKREYVTKQVGKSHSTHIATIDDGL